MLAQSSTRNEIKHKQKLLAQHRRNLRYLESQAARHGHDVPLVLHNALVFEREAIGQLERELAAAGISPYPQPNWRALVIDADPHWREIIASNVNRLGGLALEYPAFPTKKDEPLIKLCGVAIIGISPRSKSARSIEQCAKNVVKLGQHMPVILLAGWNDRDSAIAVRRAFRNSGGKVTATTIFKETFDSFWFARVVHQILTR